MVHVGAEGVSDAVVRSLEEAFNTRELLKVRVQDGAPDDVRETARQLAAAVTGAHVVQTIGRIAVIYRPDPEEPGIVFPR